MITARRILLLITDLEIGGTPTVVRELAVRLNAGGGAVVEVACLSAQGPVARELEKAGVRVTAIGARGAWQLPAVVTKLVRLAQGRRYDTVFSFLVHANAVAAAASRFLPGVRFLQSIQTTQPNPRWHWQVQALAQAAAERVVVPSPSVAAAAREWSDVPAEKLLVIPNAVGSAVPTAAGLAPSRQRICFVGRLDPIKRVPDLVHAVALLEPRYTLDVWGEGRDRAAIESAVDQCGVRSRVTVHGSTTTPQAALSAADVLVLPSDAEGFGLVLIEAMAAGVPVVATDVPGIRDVVRDGDNGLLVPPRDPSRLAQVIHGVMTDESLRRRLIEGGCRVVIERYTWDVVLPQYQRLLGVSVSARA
ncbi:MAG TPA: glycosyltransferase family 4 protein [Tepidisphaeraceae bacterium]|nr:glycosyltransferase family 4 protein [Tepidisphaeraceae bacterium]